MAYITKNLMTRSPKSFKVRSVGGAEEQVEYDGFIDEATIVEAEPESEEIPALLQDAPLDVTNTQGSLTLTFSWMVMDVTKAEAITGWKWDATTGRFIRPAAVADIYLELELTFRKGFASLVIPNGKFVAVLNNDAPKTEGFTFDITVTALAYTDSEGEQLSAYFQAADDGVTVP